MGDRQLDQLNTRKYRESFRLTFRFDGAKIELAELERTRKISPGTFGEAPIGGKHSGSWLELQDKHGEVLFHRRLHDPFETRAEHHSPDGRIEVYFREPEQGSFEVLVPAIPEADAVVFWSSPWEPERLTEPARQLARFKLGRYEGRRDERGRR